MEADHSNELEGKFGPDNSKDIGDYENTQRIQIKPHGGMHATIDSEINQVRILPIIKLS
jgi:hypothetical protein